MRTNVLFRIVRRSAILLVSAVLLTGALCGCESKKEREAKELREQEAVTREAELAEKKTSLLASARKALAEQEFEDASASVKELLDLDPGNAEAEKLDKEIEETSVLAVVAPLREETTAAVNALTDIDRGQTVGSVIDSAKAAQAAAEALHSQKQYEEATKKYQAVAALCEKIKVMAGTRDQALSTKTDSDAAQAAATRANAPKDAKKIWLDSITQSTAASATLASGEFAQARDSWVEATAGFEAAKAWAEGAQAIASIRAEYDEVIATSPDAKLETFGGETWVSTKGFVTEAKEFAAEGSWDAAIIKWTDAKAWLEASVVAARKAEQEEITRQNYLKALSNFGNELSKAKEQLDMARKTPKTKPGGKYYTDQGLDILSKCEEAEWYKLLGEVEHKKLGSVRESLKLERFYFKCPDLLEVQGAKYAAVGQLSEGSGEARIEQKKASIALEAPFEVKSRKTGIRFRLIPAGKFMMGTPAGVPKTGRDEREHEVAITRPFYMGKYEVTQSQWRQLQMRSNVMFKDSNADLPAESMLWKTAMAFCEKLCEEEGAPSGTYRLATEAEWEYACRAGTTTFFAGGKEDYDLSRVGWFDENSERKTHGVGEKLPNAWGLFDMHGNVWEWCAEAPLIYGDDLVSDPGNADKRDPHRVLRGGGWNDDYRGCRSANRGSAKHKTISSYDIGLRVLRLAPTE